MFRLSAALDRAGPLMYSVAFIRRIPFAAALPYSEEWMSLTSVALSFRRAALPAVGLLLVACAGDHPQTTFQPATAIAQRLNDVFAWTTWWTVGILALVHILLFYIIIRYRHRPGAPEPRPVHGHTGLEIAWTIIPAIIVVAIAIPTVRVIWEVQASEPGDALIVEAIGHQWWWEFRYPEYELVTANQFHLPTDRPIRMRLQSADVIHSFWIPRLHGKRDTNPVPAQPEREGHHINHLTFTVREPGQYDGQCAEFCGMSHAIMRMRAVVESPEAFAAWVSRMRGEMTAAVALPEPLPDQALPPGGAPPATGTGAPQDPSALQPGTPLPDPAGPAAGDLAAQDAALVARGRELFLSRACIACHAIEGTHARGVLGPNLTLYGERWTVGAGAAANTQENVERWIRQPQALKPAALMPGTEAGAAGMPPTMLTDEEVRAVAAYLLSLR
jgi:cytochrome c oxidase subunit II